MASRRFVAIDVETANANMASICQIGIAVFEDGRVCGEWCSLVDPEDDFDGINVSIHGIDERTVRGQPTLPAVANHLREQLQGAIVVCHTHFDRVAIAQACEKYGLNPIESNWLDSARVARRTWKEVAHQGYGLSNVCRMIGYQFRAHDALEDAKAAGQVVLAALQTSGFGLDDWLSRVRRPIDPLRSSANIHRDGNPEGDLYGEVVVFTGRLSITRVEAADLAASVGCRVCDGVNKLTSILVVGDQDVTKLAGHEKSSKHRKAEQMIVGGQQLRIVRESDFRRFVSCSKETEAT